MPQILRPGRRRSLVVVTVGLAVIATACGGSSSETGTAAPASVDDEATAPAQAESSTTTGRSTAVEPDDGGERGDGEGGDDAVASESDPGENLFPDVDVVNVADGATINLAGELGGGDLPVLLWFWAPH